ncbi:hypothetical protein GCM10023144_39300 [Pigmentiphaga soli]|uniref:Carbon monoxide dehydrogenase n=1 Tax=Pigmentiphaga soli TaxID=1007095 RepID=A0ABP8HJA8_9BURK
MEIQQSFSVPFPPDAVWRHFHDTEGIVACLPGAALTGSTPDGKLKLTMTVKLGPIVASFAGDGVMALDDASRSGSVTGGGADRKSGSRVKGEAAFSLHDETAGGAPATRVDVKVDYAITGTLAQFSRGGIVKELATRMTAAFADNLKQRLERGSETAPAAGTAATPESAAAAEPAAAPLADVPPVAEAAPVAAAAPPAAVPATAAAANQPLDLGNLFWPILWGRIKRLFGFASK